MPASIRPVVVLPHPLSPTMQIASPAPMANETPSTAVIVPPGTLNDRLTWSSSMRVRPWTVMSTTLISCRCDLLGDGDLRASDPVGHGLPADAARVVVRRVDRHEVRLALRARRDRDGAARHIRAAGRKADEIRGRARDRRDRAHRSGHARDGTQEADGIRMPGAIEKV